MPCPDFSVNVISRSAGKSAVAAAAYQSCGKLYSEYDLKTKSYTYKEKELFHEEIMLPVNAPPSYADRQTLWNSVELNEKSWNSQLARRIRMALPREVPSDQYVQMVKEYCQEQFVSKGMICDFAIHDKGDGNPHVHILLTLRSLDEQGRWCPKCRKEYVLDKEGNRITLPSGEFKSRRVDYNDWNKKDNCEKWRHGWETIQNRYLERNDRSERVDLRSYERQGVDKVPTVHMGPAVAAMERKGVETNIGNLNRDIKAANALAQSIRRIIEGLRNWLQELSKIKKAFDEANAEMNKPTVWDALSKYQQMRMDERSLWTPRARLNGTMADYDKLKGSIAYLKEHHINTIEDMLSYLDFAEKKAEDAKAVLKRNDDRYKTINSIIRAYAVLQKYQPTHDAYMKKGFKLARERFSETHKDELESYNRAYRSLMKNAGTVDINVAKLNVEIREMNAANAVAQAALDSVKEDLIQLRQIRYYVSRVMPDVVEPGSVIAKLKRAEIETDRENAERDAQRKKDREHDLER